MLSYNFVCAIFRLHGFNYVLSAVWTVIVDDYNLDIEVAMRLLETRKDAVLSLSLLHNEGNQRFDIVVFLICRY